MITYSIELYQYIYYILFFEEFVSQHNLDLPWHGKLISGVQYWSSIYGCWFFLQIIIKTLANKYEHLLKMKMKDWAVEYWFHEIYCNLWMDDSLFYVYLHHSLFLCNFHSKNDVLFVTSVILTKSKQQMSIYIVEIELKNHTNNQKGFLNTKYLFYE